MSSHDFRICRFKKVLGVLEPIARNQAIGVQEAEQRAARNRCRRVTKRRDTPAWSLSTRRKV